MLMQTGMELISQPFLKALVITSSQLIS